MLYVFNTVANCVFAGEQVKSDLECCVIDINKELMDLIDSRVELLMSILPSSHALYEMSWWDFSPVFCSGALISECILDEKFDKNFYYDDFAQMPESREHDWETYQQPIDAPRMVLTSAYSIDEDGKLRGTTFISFVAHPNNTSGEVSSEGVSIQTLRELYLGIFPDVPFSKKL